MLFINEMHAEIGSDDDGGCQRSGDGNNTVFRHGDQAVLPSPLLSSSTPTKKTNLQDVGEAYPSTSRPPSPGVRELEEATVWLLMRILMKSKGVLFENGKRMLRYVIE